jgi:hypothetical protein
MVIYPSKRFFTGSGSPKKKMNHVMMLESALE